MPTHKIFRESDSESENESAYQFEHVSGETTNEGESELSESDDDGEPEAVTFKDSKKTVLDRVRLALRQIERDRQQVKEKRRRMDAVLKEQKKQKLARLEDCRLPDEILDTVAGKSDDNVKLTAAVNAQPSVNFQELASAVNDGDLDDLDKAPDYIQLSSGSGIKAISIKQLQQTASKSQSALEFRHQQLYGKRVSREPASAVLARRAKKAAIRS